MMDFRALLLPPVALPSMLRLPTTPVKHLAKISLSVVVKRLILDAEPQTAASAAVVTELHAVLELPEIVKDAVNSKSRKFRLGLKERRRIIHRRKV